jgi:hypothetical protein
VQGFRKVEENTMRELWSLQNDYNNVTYEMQRWIYSYDSSHDGTAEKQIASDKLTELSAEKRRIEKKMDALFS